MMTPKQRTVLQFGLPLLVVLIFAAILSLMYLNKPEAKSKKETVKKVKVFAMTSAPETDVLKVFSQGEVMPVETVELRPEVDGRLVYVSEHLVAGGVFKKGDVLARINPEPYKLAVVQSSARVAQAQQLYILAKAESDAAIQELEEMKKDRASELAKGLPQLRRAKANLDSAEADLKLAELNLAYTEFTAPFTGRVLTEEVSVGQYINRNALVATLYSTELAEIRLPLTLDQLYQIGLPADYNKQTHDEVFTADLKADIGNREAMWTAAIVRTEAVLDSQTRTINAVAQVNLPYQADMPLLFGSFVQAEIKGSKRREYTKLPVKTLRNGQDLWLVENKKLKIIPADIIQRQRDFVLVDNLPAGSTVVTSTLPLPSNGLAVRVVDPNESAKKKAQLAQDKKKVLDKNTQTESAL